MDTNKHETEMSFTIHELELATQPWLDARSRAERGLHLDANLNTVERLRMARLDYLLEELLVRMHDAPDTSTA